jgi:hypothetical protein
MAWESESWQRFLDTAVQIASGKRHDWRNLFLLYPYDPADEKEALVGAQHARAALADGSITTQVISWGGYAAAFLKSQGFLRLPLNRPEEIRRLELNLADRLPEYLADRTQQALEGRPKSHIAFVVRTGAIYPFTTISQTLAVCEMRKIGATLAVLGPGHVSDRGRSFGLLTGPAHPGYPALIVGPTSD